LRWITITDVRQSYAEFLTLLRQSLLGPLGMLPLNTREDILAGRILEPALNAFVVRVRANASSVTQEHLDELRKQGLSEDAIFDAAVCAAVVAGVERYDCGMQALNGSRHAP
jgi:hypothetical protein